MGNNSQERDTVEIVKFADDSPELIREKEDTKGFVLVAFTTAQFKKLSDSGTTQLDKRYFVHDRDISEVDMIFKDIKKSSTIPTNKKKNAFSRRISGISSVCSSSSGNYGDISSGISSSSASSKRDR